MLNFWTWTMPFQMRIQPIDSHIPEEETRSEPVKPVVKSRLKRLFERQFSGVLRNPPAEKIAGEEPHLSKDGFNGSHDFEPSSVCLVKMVQNFIEENHEKHSVPVKCGGNCFNGNCDDISDGESDVFGGIGDSNNYASPAGSSEILKGLVACASVCERNLLANTANIIEKNKINRRKDDFCRKIIIHGLLALGYDASICKSRWEKSPFCPAGEYEYIDVMIGNDRLIIDIEFRSEFEVARSTKTYKTVLQTLPHVFVGKSERLQSIIAIVSDAAKQSLKKKGMHIPPWRKAEYVKAKWLSPYRRTTPPIAALSSQEIKEKTEEDEPLIQCTDFKPSNKEENSNSAGAGDDDELDESLFTLSNGSSAEGDNIEKAEVMTACKPPDIKPASPLSGVKVVTGLAAVFDDTT